MLISTRILRKYASKTVVARDWRVVDIPDEDAGTTTLSILYQNICSHTYDAMEPFQPTLEDMDAPLKAEIGSTQTGGDFQSLPLTVCVGEVVRLFGLYIKLYILMESPTEETTLPVRITFLTLHLQTASITRHFQICTAP